MFRQMVQLWIAIPIIMTVLVLISLAVDRTYKFVDQNYMVSAVAVLVTSIIGLACSMYAWLKWK